MNFLTQPTPGVGTIQGDLIRGLEGNDTLYGLTGADVLDGGADNDQLYGDAGDDVLIGGDGNDHLYGEEGNDNLYGGAGNDSLRQDQGNGVLDGGDGNDRLDASTNYTGVLGAETLIGGDGDDQINYVGVYSVDVVDAGAGSDTVRLYTQGWNATIYGQASITLGAGADTLLIDRYTDVNAFNSATVTDFNVSEDQIVFNDYLSQQLTGWDGASNPFGVGFMRLVDDGLGNSVLEIDENGGGDSYVSYITFTGVSAASFTSSNFLIEAPTLQGYEQDGSGINGGIQTGTPGSDALVGSIGDDSLEGLAGSDTLAGGNGNDTIIGGADADQISGGFGANSFVFALGEGADVIQDFDVGTDVLTLTGG